MQGLRHQFQSQFHDPITRAVAPLIKRLHRKSSQPIEARKRSTHRATDEVDPPRDPFRKNSAWRSGGSPFQGNSERDFNASKRAKEPFEAELLILFGLPTLIILIPWAVKDPAALAIIPIAFLIPGVRDVLLAVLRSTFLGVRRAKKFMREDDDYYRNDDTSGYRRSASAATRAWSARSPMAGTASSAGGSDTIGALYDLSQEDFTVQPTDRLEFLEEEEENEKESEQLENDRVVEDVTPLSDVSSPPSSPSPPPFSSPSSSKRRWVSYNTSASFAEDDQERKRNQNTARETNNIKNLNTEVKRLRNVPPSPLAEVRWRDQQQQTGPTSSRYNDSNSNEDNYTQNNDGYSDSVIDEELDELKLRQARERRRQARAARRNQRRNNQDSLLARSTQTLEQRRKSRSPLPRTSNNNNSFWGDDTDGYYENSTKSAGRGAVRKGGVPWYARPLVSLFPFLKDWGGFM